MGVKSIIKDSVYRLLLIALFLLMLASAAFVFLSLVFGVYWGTAAAFVIFTTLYLYLLFAASSRMQDEEDIILIVVKHSGIVCALLLALACFTGMILFFVLGQYVKAFVSLAVVFAMLVLYSMFLHQKNKYSKKTQLMNSRKEQAQASVSFNCPDCGQAVRVPSGKGKIAVSCPICRTRFIRST